VLVGQGTKIEIWDEARWEAQVAQALNVSDDDMPVELEGFTL
jgi:MraZ protein